jgi:CRISPR-associated endonuclease/helicase Cas3
MTTGIFFCRILAQMSPQGVSVTNNHFWAKTTSEDKPGISVTEHMTNVGYVALRMAELSKNLLERFQLNSAEVGALAALHDLGKISPGFQMKCTTWLEENGLSGIARNGCWDTRMESDHGKVSHAAIQNFLSELCSDCKTAKFLSAVLGGHHGRLNPPNDRGYHPQGAISENRSGIDWEKERDTAARNVWRVFAGNTEITEINDSLPALWWLAGLTSVADWIGSDERFFRSDPNTAAFDPDESASKALRTIGFKRPEIIHGLSFHELFLDRKKPGIIWSPNDMQAKTAAAITAPGVYVIEAPMGMGKTEAALWAAYLLLAEGKATGIYFALPTQATSNRIHLRVNEFISRISPESNRIRLIHGNSWLMDADAGIAPVATGICSASNDARYGRDWFASSKRALLAPFGVGTVDQALLGVVAAKHFFVRHFALAGKVVVIDEVHSYDLYTGTLIDKLIRSLEGLGCTVIILSATLTGKRRGQIIASGNNAAEDDSNLPYPLVSGRQGEILLNPVPATPPGSLEVQVSFKSEGQAMEKAIELAEKGGCILWICNTVNGAQNQFRRFKEFSGKGIRLGLLHSRFPFHRREKLENEWMERLGKSSDTRCGSILVSTQIVEQSVDLDADLMITELAPTDMLLQRLGRLWRHKRGNRPVKEPQIIIIEEEKCLKEFRDMKSREIMETLGGKARVYDPFVLLRTLQTWQDYPCIKIPGQIREILEATYRERDDDPESWQKLIDDRFVSDSNKRFKALLNSNYWQLQLPDEEGVQTRLNDMPTVSIVLCHELSENEAIFFDATRGSIGGDEFRLATAQAIHKNLVKVPAYCFEHVEPCLTFSAYLHGAQSVAVVGENGFVEVEGLKDGIRFIYTDKLGLVIEKSTGGEDV